MLVDCQVAGGCRGGDGVEQGDPEGGADLLAGVEQGARHPGIPAIDVDQAGAGGRGEDQAETEPDHKFRDQQVGEVVGVDLELGQPDEPRRGDGQAGRHERPRAHAGQEPAGPRLTLRQCPLSPGGMPVRP